MNEDTLREISEIVRKNLPAHLSEELQKALKQGSEAIKTIETSQAYTKRLEAEKDKLNAQLGMHGDVRVREEAVKKREDEVTKRELKAELNEYKVEAATRRCEDLKHVTLAVFANNQFKYERSTSRNETHYGEHGMNKGSTSGGTTETVRSEGTPE